MLRSFSSSTLTRQTIQRITSSTTTSRSINFKPTTSHSRLLTLSTTRQPNSSSSSIQRIHTRSALSSRSSIESSSAVARLAQQQVHHQHRRHRCTCAHHNQISMSLDGVDKSMGVITGGVAEMAGQRDAYRLPTEVIPTHYDLVFKTDLEGLTFEGEGLIHLDIAQSTNSIQFNLNPSVHLTKISVILPSGEEIHYDPPSPIRASESGDDETPGETNRETEPTRVTVDLDDIKAGEIKVDKDQERFALGLPSGKLEKGAKGVKVRAAWKDVLGGSMMGYYRSSFPHEDGKDTYYALTQFEPTAARRAYPAWDEPAIKATYSIALLGRKGLVSLGNMPVEHEAEWNGALEYDGVKLGENLTKAAKGEEWTLTKFEKTPLVSSYLVAFAHGPFASLSSEYTSPLTGKVIPLKIYATPDLIGQAQFALDVKRMALPVYEEIFDVPYPLPKLDTLVAHDFDAGAMENWGLITGRTTAYLYDEKKSSLAAKKRIIDVQSHECAHMWFGNIVSPKWWDVLWLNEAFATLQGEVIIPDRIFPEFKVRREFLTTHLIAALSLDAVRSSHPIEVPCPDANQINQIFDSISYSKGASVLRMLAAVVGEDKFLKGVSIYLKKHLYGNASTKDLWAGISEASGVDVTRIMNEWILNVGFPVISVEELDGGKRIKVRQDRFLNTGDVKPEENKTIWYVPLELKTVVDGKVSVDHKAILSERELEIDLNGASAFKLNAETVGVYRVAYSPERLAKLGEEAAKPDSIFSVEDRIGLVSDATTLARAGSGKTSGSLNLVSKLGGETEYAVWDSIAVGLGKLKAVWWEQPEDVRKAIDKFRNKLFKPIVERMGFDFGENDDPDTRQLRTLAISVAAGSEDAETIAEIQKRFKPFLENGDDSQIPPDLQRCIYTIAVRHGGEAEWKKIREVYDKPPTASAKIDALMSLGATQKPELIEKTFTMLHDGSIKDQDVMYGFVSLSSNRLATRKVAAYFKDNYKTMMKRFGDNFAMNRLVTYAFNSLTTEKDLKEVDDFFKDKDNSKYKLSLAQVRDTIMAQSHWLIRDQEDVKQWLKDNKYL